MIIPLKSSRRSLARTSLKAFTLVETVLAMGIVVFAMLPILGLVPVGLGNLRDAISLTVESQIVQGLSNEILLTNYDTVLTQYADSNSAGSGGGPVSSASTSQHLPYLYDEEGALLVDDKGNPITDKNDPRKIYTVAVTLSDVSVPAGPGITNPVTSKCAVIEITSIKHPSNGNRHSLVIPKA